MLFKIIFYTVLIYAGIKIYNLFKMMNKASRQHVHAHTHQGPKARPNDKPRYDDGSGEYVDYEEIK